MATASFEFLMANLTKDHDLLNEFIRNPYAVGEKFDLSDMELTFLQELEREGHLISFRAFQKRRYRYKTKTGTGLFKQKSKDQQFRYRFLDFIMDLWGQQAKSA